MNNGTTGNNRNRGVSIITMILFLVVIFWLVRGSFVSSRGSYTMGDFNRDLEQKNVEGVVIAPNRETPTGSVIITMKDGTEKVLYVTDVKEAEKQARDYGLDPEVRDIPPDNSFLTSIMPMILIAVLCIFFFHMMTNQGGAGNANNKMMNFGKSKAKRSEGDRVTLDDVAGLQEEREDLAEIIDFLRDPAKYTKVRARIPKGVLLEGVPGTGKTLLAKAVAGEAKVPFFSISGSDFVEFIDEIDAVARRRGTGLGGSHDEREQTLNQLLVEMDGFGVNEGIIVMAATNRADILDPAILRPGRFDRKISVGRPDVKGREEILKVHARGKPLAEDVNLQEVARTTAGFTGADLENLLNEAAIMAAKADRSYIVQEDIKAAFIKVGIGDEKKSHVISDKEKRITAFHETGHAILFHELDEVGNVYTISVIPTGLGAGGYTMPLPEKDEMYLTRNHMLQEIMVDLGGRIAEELVLDDITTGASNDIQKATAMARQMVTRYGMSARIGTINYEQEAENVFLGYDLGHESRHSEYISGEIDKEVKLIIDECYKKAKEIIKANEDILYRAAELLIEKEKLTGAEFEALFAERNNSLAGLTGSV